MAIVGMTGDNVRMDFDEYRAAHHITPEQVPIVFAAWLRSQPDGEWDGDLRPLHGVDDDVTPSAD